MRRPGDPPTLSAFDIGCVVIGGILGVGIFFTPRAVARAVEGPGEVVLAWSIGGLIAVLGAMVFAELSGRVPGHGGMFAYIHRAFGARPSFLYGWANWLVIQSGAMAVIALVLVDYAAQLVGLSEPPGDGARIGIAAAAILLFTVLNAFGLRVGRGLQNGLTVVKVVAVFALILLGCFAFGGEGSELPTATPGRDDRDGPGLAARLAAAMLPVLFSFGGWQQGSFVAGAARRARDVAVGILVGVAVVVVAYLGVNLAFLALLGFEGARASEAIGADAVRVALTPFGLGDIGARALAALVVVSSLGILNTICLAPPFVLHAMSKEGLFPDFVGRLHPTRHVPVVAILVQGLWAVFLLMSTQAWARVSGDGGAGDVLGFLLDGVVFVDWLFFGLCGLALFRLRHAESGDHEAGYRIRHPRLVAGAFTLFALSVTTGAVATSPTASLSGLAVCAVGYVIDLRRSRRGGDRGRCDRRP
jgi:APA family basic amino acid/polyamine antiporter